MKVESLRRGWNYYSIILKALLAILLVGYCLGGIAHAKVSNPNDLSSDSDARHSPIVYFVITADESTTDFWFRGIAEHSSAAAKALNITLEQGWVGVVRPTILKTVEDRLKRSPKPDYLVFTNERSIGADMLALAEQYEVDAFLYIAALDERTETRLGPPRQHLSHWIGQLVPDDEQAGYDLAVNLIRQARYRRGNCDDGDSLKMLAISGRNSSMSSKRRVAGLRRALSEHDDVELLQLVSARWSQPIAQAKYRLLKQRYGDVDMVWLANDQMALGVIEESRVEDRPPLVGSVDWIPPAIDALRAGNLSVSLGGHNFDVAYVLALLRLHFDGMDFVDRAGSATLRSHLMPLTLDSLEEYEAFLKKYNRNEIDYISGFSTVLDDLGRTEAVSYANFMKNAARLSESEDVR